MSEKAMADWTAIPEEVRKELVRRLRGFDLRAGAVVSTLYAKDFRAFITELVPPPPPSDAEKLEAIRKHCDEFGGLYSPLAGIRAILEGRRP